MPVGVLVLTGEATAAAAAHQPALDPVVDDLAQFGVMLKSVRNGIS